MGMEEKQIRHVFTDTGHWMARCDHSTNVIELNDKEFYKLSPLHQEYIWIHENVHLLYDVYDEAECNRITDEIFLSKSKSDRDRAERIRFIASSNDYGKSNWVAALISAVVGIGTTITSAIVGKRNSGYYSLSLNDRLTLVDMLLKESFEDSLLTDVQSARDIFWSAMEPMIARKKEKEFSAWAKKNDFVYDYIEKYEKLYDVPFEIITPIAYLKHPKYKRIMISVGVVAIVLALIVLMLVTRKKNK